MNAVAISLQAKVSKGNGVINLTPQAQPAPQPQPTGQVVINGNAVQGASAINVNGTYYVPASAVASYLNAPETEQSGTVSIGTDSAGLFLTDKLNYYQASGGTTWLFGSLYKKSTQTMSMLGDQYTNGLAFDAPLQQRLGP